MTERRTNYLFKYLKMIAESEIKNSLIKVKNIYGKDNAIKVEALFRNETKHFKSGNFQICFSPGMEATVENYPYGWSSLKPFWESKPEYKPIGIHEQIENSSGLLASRGERKFIKFPTLEAAMLTVAFRLNNKGWNTGAWFSNNPESQKKYSDYLLRIKTPIANSL